MEIEPFVLIEQDVEIEPFVLIEQDVEIEPAEFVYFLGGSNSTSLHKWLMSGVVGSSIPGFLQD